MDNVNWSALKNAPSFPPPDVPTFCPPTHPKEFLCVDCERPCCSHCCILHLNSTPARHTAVSFADALTRETERSANLQTQLRRLSAALSARRESLERLPPESLAFLNGLPDHVRTLKDIHSRIEQATGPPTLNRLSDPRPQTSSSAQQYQNNPQDNFHSLRVHNDRLRDLVAQVTKTLQPPEGQLGELLLAAARSLLGPQATEGSRRHTCITFTLLCFSCNNLFTISPHRNL